MNRDDTLRLVFGIILAIGSGLFLLPTGIALARNRQGMTGIVMWNTFGSLLFGVGWVVALVKALQDNMSPATP
jgi:hypothetical protein